MTLRAFAATYGVNCPIDLPAGRWIRVSTTDKENKKNGSVKMSDDGRVGWVVNHATMGKPEMWRASDDKDAKPIFIDPREVASRRKQRLAEMAEATQAAQAYYAASKPLSTLHPYLVSKGLDSTGCAGVRVHKDGCLVIPMLSINRQIVSAQRIWPDSSKKFWPGAPSKNTFFEIKRKQSSITILTEGVATALSLAAALPDATIIVTFSASNLPLVAQSLHPVGLVTVASDNDHQTLAKIGTNPGLEAAKLAAQSIGCGIAVPDCEEGESDFNDLFQRLYKEQQDKAIFVKGRKPSEHEMRGAALAGIKREIMRNLKMVTKTERQNI